MVCFQGYQAWKSWNYQRGVNLVKKEASLFCKPWVLKQVKSADEKKEAKKTNNFYLILPTLSNFNLLLLTYLDTSPFEIMFYILKMFATLII